MIHRKRMIVPPNTSRFPEFRDGSFSMAGRYGKLPNPVTINGWSPGMGELTAQEQMTAALAAITSVGTMATQAILTPKLVAEQRKVELARAQVDAIKAEQWGETLRQFAKTAGTVGLVVGGAYLLMSGGRAILKGRRS